MKVIVHRAIADETFHASLLLRAWSQDAVMRGAGREGLGTVDVSTNDDLRAHRRDGKHHACSAFARAVCAYGKPSPALVGERPWRRADSPHHPTATRDGCWPGIRKASARADCRTR